MKSNIFKKGVSLLMSAVMCLSTFMGVGSMTAFAAAEQSEVYIVGFPRDGDANYSADWGHPNLSYMNGWNAGSSRYTNIRAIGSYDGNVCYCIEPGVPQDTGDTFTAWDENFWENYPDTYNKTITGPEIKDHIGRILQYGYRGQISTAWRSQNEGADKLAHVVATQLLIWETVVGERDSDFSKVSTGGHDAVLDSISSNHPLRDRIMSYYNSIESSVLNHTTIPSFFSAGKGSAPQVEMEWNGENYVATLTDSNGVLDDFSFTADVTGMNFSVDGNTLTITSDTAPIDTVTITASKLNSQRYGVITWTDSSIGPNGGSQDTVTYAQPVNDPVFGYLKLNVSFGGAEIIKASEDGNVAGISFHISGEGIDQTVQTDGEGKIRLDNLKPGIYTVAEQSYDQYEPQEVRRVTVVSGQTATVTFNNVLKRGDLAVYKNSEDGLNEGMTFHLYGTSLSGHTVDEYAITDSDGIAYFPDVLIGSGYILEEVDTADRYVIPDSQTAAVEWNTVTNKTFSNILKKWNVTVTKSDVETGGSQGDASLAGAVYGVYKGDQLMDSYTTDANGQFTTDYYVCGDDWTIREITPSEGYLLDSTVHKVGASAGNFTIEYNILSRDVTEQVLKGQIALIKHTDNGETQLETPEVGAEFQVYLKSAGSYDSAKDSERDYLICDENGFAQTKSLPYGIYTVHQTSGWDGRELLSDFDVFISQNGEVYRYIANNAPFESFIKVVKVDAESGNPIPYAGAGFKLYRPDGSLITQTFTYPEVTTLDTFYTNDEGFLITPESLEYGTGYSLVEVSAPYGYVLNTEPVYFDVTEENSTEEDSVTVISVTKANTAQKGVISVSKSGEVFASVTQNEGFYQPVYAVQGLPGAVFEIAAAKDIYTLDGTLRYAAGEIVDTLTTDADGKAVSKALYLGKYQVREITAPEGMVLNNEAHEVELVYAGQEVEITETATSFYNDRQKVQISLNKFMEINDLFGIGNNGEVTAVTFGLYASEEMVAADGCIIPADGLMEIVSVSENGSAICKADLPFGSYYLKEMTTDNHYVLSDAVYPVTFAYGGQDMALVEIKANDGDTIENELMYGCVEGMKTEENGNGLAGAVIGLFRADESVFSENTAIMTTTSAEDGSFGFANIPYGNWIVREIAAPNGYVLSDVSYPVNVSADGDVIAIEIVNAVICGNVQLTKVDKNYPDHTLAGAEFEVYADTNGNGVIDKDDTSLGKMQELSNGIYQMNDLVFGSYLLKETKAPTGFYLDTNTYAFSITENCVTVVVENEAGKGFINAAQTGSVRIEKTSEDGVLKGFTFRVTGSDVTGQVFSKEYVTDENGEIHIDGLRIGDYEISEVANEATKKYELPANVTVTVLEGKTTVAKFYNKLIPEIPDVPKTGDNTNIGLWAALAVISLAGAGATGFLAFRKKNGKEGK